MKKRFGIGWYGGVVAAVLMVLAMIGYYVMSRDGEAAPFTVYAAALAGLVLQAVALGLTARKGENPISGVADILSAVCCTAALALMAQARMSVVVTVFANHVGNVGKPLVVTAVLFGAAIVVKVIASFLAQSKEPSAA